KSSGSTPTTYTPRQSDDSTDSLSDVDWSSPVPLYVNHNVISPKQRLTSSEVTCPDNLITQCCDDGCSPTENTPVVSTPAPPAHRHTPSETSNNYTDTSSNAEYVHIPRPLPVDLDESYKTENSPAGREEHYSRETEVLAYTQPQSPFEITLSDTSTILLTEALNELSGNFNRDAASNHLLTIVDHQLPG
ncbi:hypothetical protein PHET_12031, partial [Paragonimus heterotremus]